VAACQWCGGRAEDRPFCPACGTDGGPSPRDASPLPPVPPAWSPPIGAPPQGYGPGAAYGAGPGYGSAYPVAPGSPAGPGYRTGPGNPAPAGAAPVRARDRLAVIAFLMSSLAVCLPLTVFVAIVALSRIQRSGAPGRGLAIAAIAICVGWLVLAGGLATR
jgi:hypothetical protein